MSNDRPPAGYKQTAIGLIPEDWESFLLGEVVTLHRGFDLPSRLRKPGNVPIVSSSGVIDQHDQPSVLSPGVVTGRYGTIGEVFFINEDFWALNTTLFVSNFKGNNPLFIYFFLRTIDYKSYSGKSGVPGVNRNDLHEIPVKLPPLPEQRSLAQALSDVDTLIAALDKTIAKKRNLKTATMQQLLTGKKRLPGFGEGKGYKESAIGVIPEDWDVSQVSQVTSGHKQGYYTKERYVEHGTRLVRITDLYNPKIDYESMPMLIISDNDFEQYKISRGDFLFARSGAIGRYGIVEDDVDAIFGSYIIRFTFNKNKLLNSFFGYLFETQVIWKQLLSITQGSSNININAGNIKALKIPLPHSEEQHAIATVLSDMDGAIAALEARLAKTQAIKQGMMQALLTGRVRLKIEE